MISTSFITNACVFCREGREPGSANLFLPPEWPCNGRVLFATDSLFMIPGYGPQVFPYILLVTKRHITSLAQANREERHDILSTLKCLRGCQSLGVESLFVFEHAGCQNIDSCIEHFHLHIIDGRHDLTAAFKDHSVYVTELTEFTELPSSSYLMALKVEKGGIGPLIISKTAEKRDQFFRRALAEKIGRDVWDWRSGMNPHLMLKLMEKREALELEMNCCVAKLRE